MTYLGIVVPPPPLVEVFVYEFRILNHKVSFARRG
jgi:hypothetical protein